MEEKKSLSKKEEKTDMELKNWVHTDLGFGILNETRNDGFSEILLNWGDFKTFKAFIHKEEVSKEIKVTIWTFLEDKPHLEESFNVNSSVGELVKKICEHFDVLKKNIVLVSNGFTIDIENEEEYLGNSGLSPTKPFEILLLVKSEISFKFDPYSIGGDIAVNPSGLSASIPFGSPGQIDCSILGTTEITKGKVFWDVLIVSCAESRINLGVGTKNINLNSYCGSNEFGWSYYASNGQAEHGGQSVPYAEMYVTGDIIRVKLDMTKSTLSFCKNGVELGIAHSNIPPRVYPAFSLYSVGDTIELIKFGSWN